jgi:hypothetical protein
VASAGGWPAIIVDPILITERDSGQPLGEPRLHGMLERSRGGAVVKAVGAPPTGPIAGLSCPAKARRRLRSGSRGKRRAQRAAGVYFIAEQVAARLSGCGVWRVRLTFWHRRSIVHFAPLRLSSVRNPGEQRREIPGARP